MRVPGLKRVRRELLRLRGRVLGGGVILGYHRVADDPLDPHRLVVSPRAFEEHLEAIRRHFVPRRLEELLEEHPADEGVAGGPRRPLAVTFDDGYADLLHRALPLLERHRIHATVFVVSGAVGRERFDWDEPRDGREGRPLDLAELRRLADSEWVGIGAHTRTHPDLRGLRTQQVEVEVRGSRERLEDVLGRPVHDFSYPHGGTSPAIRSAVARAGFLRACASRPGLVGRGADPFHLPRFWPPDLRGRGFDRWLAARTGVRRRPAGESDGRRGRVTRGAGTR